MDPDAYREVAGQLESHRKGREAYVRRAMEELQAALAEAGIEAELSGRPKHIYSIHKKMQRKRAEFGEIYDVHALRVLVDDVRECYAALGVVHSLWRPIPGQFDDYIAMPKNNMYQSLHTAVVALDGKPLEVQIRSHDMHRVSEVGIAAHWRYKEGSRTDRAYDAKLAWVRQLMEWQRTSRTPPSSSRASSSTSSRTRSSSSRPRATSRTCRPAPRRSTSPTASTPRSATPASAPRSTTASCRSTTS